MEEQISITKKLEKEQINITMRQSSKKRRCLGRADNHWGEVKAVDPKSCYSGHLKIWNFIILRFKRELDLSKLCEFCIKNCAE